MNEELKSSRRQFLKLGGAAIIMIPIMSVSGNARAAVNAQMRTAMKYQDKPNGTMHCANCLHFIPGKTAKSLGGCQIFPGDTEISPNGYCIGWVAKPA